MANYTPNEVAVSSWQMSQEL